MNQAAIFFTNTQAGGWPNGVKCFYVQSSNHKNYKILSNTRKRIDKIDNSDTFRRNDSSSALLLLSGPSKKMNQGMLRKGFSENSARYFTNIDYS